MSFRFRVLLLAAAVLAFLFMIHNIRKSKFVISDSIFWFFFSALLVLLAVVPEIAYYFTKQLGIISASNLVYLVVIGLLIIRIFQMDLRISDLSAKLKTLVQNQAILDDLKKEENEDEREGK